MGTYKTSGKTWLEVSVNGPWGAALQPNAPIIEEEIVKESVHCHRLGAAIIHLHAFDANGNEVNDDPDRYERMIKAIKRQAPDAIVYPTVPSKAGSELLKPEERYKVAEELGKRPGVLEWTSVDPGSCNLSRQSVVMSGRSDLPKFRVSLVSDLFLIFSFHSNQERRRVCEP